MTFAFPVSVSLVPVAVALLVTFAAVFLWRKRVKGAAVVVFVIGGFIAFVFGPMLFLDRVTLDAGGVRQKTGFWFAPTEKGIEFQGLERVRIAIARDRKGREYGQWIAKYADGSSVAVDPGDLWETNAGPIIAYMEKMGIQVEIAR